MEASEDLRLFELQEDPDLWEAAMEAEQQRAKTDPAARQLLEAIYYDADREAAFQRFFDGLELRTILALLPLLGVQKHHTICELGGGPGWLGWALRLHGYEHLEMLEPNNRHTTGTGYLRSRPDAQDIKIWNELSTWYTSPEKVDVVLTHNCVHHFRHLSYVAACVRKKIRPGGRWVMIREPYVESSSELYSLLRTHPYSQRYGLFEYAMPAHHYVEAVELAGFKLSAVVPADYANNTLSMYVEDPGGRRTKLLTSLINGALTLAPKLTAAAFKAERWRHLIAPGRTGRFYRPQVMMFERVDVAL